MTRTEQVTHAARRLELDANLSEVRARIAAACGRANRQVEEVRLIAVTKTFPATDVALLAELAVTDVAENRDQEAAAKVAAVRAFQERIDAAPVRWHFVGALQTNKCGSVVSYASAVHSVDRLRLVEALGRAMRNAVAAGAPAADALGAGGGLGCFVQVDLDEVSKPGRGGARPDEVAAIAAAVAREPGLRLEGVMTVAPLGSDPVEAFRAFATIADAVRQRHPEATAISAGMSADFEVAIACGATHRRVGAALLGVRRHPVG
jgi:PLP dependent protein